MEQKKTEKIIIFDTSLRDGEQAPGATMTLAEKINIAESLDNMGVDVIEAGFAIASPGDFNCIETICKQVKNASVCSLARAKKTDIETAHAALKTAFNPRIHTFISTSAIHMQHQLKMTQEEVLQAIYESVYYARRLCANVEWSAMDATRSDIDFLARAVETAISAGATTINIPDTVGYTIPSEYAALIRTIREKVPNSDKAIISVHCHNDLGLAVANSLAAISAGARQIECTVNGIGERAGNAALEEIVMAIKTRRDQFNYMTQVDPKHIAAVSKLVSAATGFPIQKNKAIVGANAFAHESGIHQDGMLKARETYEIISPESVGFGESELVLGKHSGRAALRDKLKSLGIELNETHFSRVFNCFKRLGDAKKQIGDEDIIALVSDKESQIIALSEAKLQVIWLNGEFVPWDEAKTHVLTHGLHYASSVFEGERAYEGNVFKLTEHNRRLHESANILGFKIPYSVSELNTVTRELLKRNQLKNAYIRPVAWCGTETLSVASQTCSVQVAIAAWEWRSYFAADDLFNKGLKLMWADWVRPSPSMAPVKAKAAGLYMIGSLSKNKAERAGFHDALMLDYRGYVAECTGANFFMVKDGVIYTPIADCFLNGITRQTIIKLARKHHIPVIERHIYPHEIAQADEVFITGSAVEVAPVGQIGNHRFPVGNISKTIAAAYSKLVRGHEYENIVRQDSGAA
ncbi:TPA: 2-isopropylmalate synthase [Legionella feeleii]|uniref:Branched-chain-amino-acid aminotransferase n=1 Tax=Legionella feeleii TaxID=453 RepID=A0A378IVH9_9GAMM|nr:2-isopropylmalate synthase [Legionella feeleii]STX39248.1 D-alanine transaminase [Legionella feeleii]